MSLGRKIIAITLILSHAAERRKLPWVFYNLFCLTVLSSKSPQWYKFYRNISWQWTILTFPIFAIKWKLKILGLIETEENIHNDHPSPNAKRPWRSEGRNENKIFDVSQTPPQIELSGWVGSWVGKLRAFLPNVNILENIPRNHFLGEKFTDVEKRRLSTQQHSHPAKPFFLISIHIKFSCFRLWISTFRRKHSHLCGVKTEDLPEFKSESDVHRVQMEIVSYFQIFHVISAKILFLISLITNTKPF